MPLDVFQQVFLLSVVANLVNDRKGTQAALQKALQSTLSATLPAIAPGWELAWGPVVWKHEPDENTTGPDNSWYVAFHPALEFEDGSEHPAYVIAIAGTPSESNCVWTNQNFAVDTVSDFVAWVNQGIQNFPVVVQAKDVVPGNKYIATGTVNAVHLLLNTPAPAGAPAAGGTLLDFIANINYTPRFISTGYSLGGALSPSLALALVSAGVIPADQTLTYPIAGASPGDVSFAKLFQETFPPRKAASAKSYQGWNLNLVNKLDVVPQAWAQKSISKEQNLGNIPPIYGLPVLPIVFGAIFLFSLHSLRSGVRYCPLLSQYFTAQPPSETPKSLKEFLAILDTSAYFAEVGVPIPVLTVPQDITLGEKTADETRFDYPVIAELEWAREHPQEAQKEIEKVENSPEGKAFLSDA